MPRTFRRVVTGVSKEGKAVCISDGEATSILEPSTRPGVRLTDLWITSEAPAYYDGPEETVNGPVILHPPPEGSVFRIVEFQPEDPDIIANIDGREAFAAMGASDNVIANSRHPYMHKTDSVDYVIVMSGEITMLLDEEDVHLKAGDVVIQRGTNHAWANRGTEPCVLVAVLLDGLESNAE